MEEEEVYSATCSDAEIDSEVEDSDMDAQFGVWLDELNAIQQDGSGSYSKKPPVNPRLTLTPKQVMESFRSSFLEGAEGQGDVDLDAILGELCELETTLNTQQTQINTSLKEVHTASPKVTPKFQTQPEQSTDLYSEASLGELDLQLQSALSELSDIAGFEGFSDPGQDSLKGQGQVQGHVSQTTLTSLQDIPSVPSISEPPVSTVQKQVLNNNNVESMHNVKLSQRLSAPRSFPKPNLDSDKKGGDALQGMSEGLPYPELQDMSPELVDVDSAFSDSSSLPSSGSHVSVTTTSSGLSNQSGASGGSSSGVSVTHSSPMTDSDTDMQDRLEAYRAQLEKENLPPAEQAAKLKKKKVPTATLR